MMMVITFKSECYRQMFVYARGKVICPRCPRNGFGRIEFSLMCLGETLLESDCFHFLSGFYLMIDIILPF